MASTGLDRPPSVTILCARFRPERYGGVEERLWRVTNTMVDRGWRVDVITENRLSAPEAEEMRPGLRVRRLPPFAPKIAWRWYYAAQVHWWFRALGRCRPTGLIWATDPVMAVAAILAGYRRRLVFNPASCAAGVAFIGAQHPEATSLHVPRELEWLDRFAYRRARAVIVSSRNIEAQFTRFYGTHPNLVVVPHAGLAEHVPFSRDEARATLGLPPDAFVVGFVGRLDPCKGVEFLFEGARAAELQAGDTLLMVGDGPDRQRLQGLASGMNLDRVVQWAGHTTEPTRYFAAMDALVLPSIYEAFGLVILEAMACGLPVIGRGRNATDTFTAADELIDHGRTGFVTETADPGELATHLAWLRAHPDDRRRMGEAARAFAASQTWTTVIAGYERVVASLV